MKMKTNIAMKGKELLNLKTTKTIKWQEADMKTSRTE
jgi:hypothetical protein